MRYAKVCALAFGIWVSRRVADRYEEPALATLAVVQKERKKRGKDRGLHNLLNRVNRFPRAAYDGPIPTWTAVM